MASLSIGIVGLPNVGKSTLFNAITSAQAEVQNYPFCTIEPNTGIVPIHDDRIAVLSKMSRSAKSIYATIEFTDIAGLVKGASTGEGLGNKFLANIREVSAIAHVVRCFDDSNITHVSGKIDPLDDIEIINLELILADLAVAEKMKTTLEKKVRGAKDKDDLKRIELLAKSIKVLESGKPVRSLEFDDEENKLLKQMSFLTAKKVIYVANVSEADLKNGNDYINMVKDFAEKNNDAFAVISARIEAEIAQLDLEERKEYFKELGVASSGLDVIAHECFDILGLQTFLTTGPKETRAWTIRKGDTAPQAAGVIHSDFERGFIRANIVSYDDFVANNGLAGAREKGLLRQEGKTYIMRDGDVVEFLFNV